MSHLKSREQGEVSQTESAFVQRRRARECGSYTVARRAALGC